jgi:uncharacterized protein
VLVWPRPGEVDAAVRRWAAGAAVSQPAVRRLGYFGSYARGDWGVGSDVDIVAVVTESSQAFEHRSSGWDLTSLPVPADIVIYTDAEWSALMSRKGRFAETLARETVWVWP